MGIHKKMMKLITNFSTQGNMRTQDIREVIRKHENTGYKRREKLGDFLRGP